MLSAAEPEVDPAEAAAAAATVSELAKYDAKATELARELAQAFPTRATLQEIAPRFFVAKHEGLSWEEAVAEADRRFGKKQPERASFLRQYLREGLPEAQLAELQLPRSGLSMTTGSGLSASFAFGTLAKPEAQINVWVANGRLLKDVTFHLKNIDLKGVAYRYVYFGEGDKLNQATRELPREADGRHLTVMVLLWGTDSRRYAATVKGAGGLDETMQFTPELVLEKREVSRGPSLHFTEEYFDGKLRRRLYLRQRTTAAGTQSYYGTEKFP